LALPGFPELMLVTAELFHRSAVAAELSPATVRYEGLFGLSIDGYGAKARSSASTTRSWPAPAAARRGSTR
jgi:hypothetical protein